MDTNKKINIATDFTDYTDFSLDRITGRAGFYLFRRRPSTSLRSVAATHRNNNMDLQDFFLQVFEVGGDFVFVLKHAWKTRS